MGRVLAVDAAVSACKVGVKTFISIDFEAGYNDDGRVEIFLASEGVDSAVFGK